MLIAGTERWKVTITEPEVLRIALYIRDAAGLRPVTDPAIPPLDPPADLWPVWARRPVEVSAAAPRRALGRREIDPEAAAEQWARWWRHCLDLGTSAIDELRPPQFPDFGQVPDLRALLQQHYHNASIWSDNLKDDPRFNRAHTAPGRGLNALIKQLPAQLGRHPRPFSLRISVIDVRTKHAWDIAPDHVLMTRPLVGDLDNVLDWLRLRIRQLA